MAYRRLPVAPDLDHLKNQAKRLLAAFREGEPGAAAAFSAFHPDQPDASAAKLTDAQLVLARSYRQPSFPSLLTTARIQRALHDNDVAALQAITADQPDALKTFSSMLEGRARPQNFSASRRVTRRNVHAFLRAHAVDLPMDDLELVDGGRYGSELAFRYGSDRIVKVPKNGHRQAQLTEARLLEYLRQKDLPLLRVPKPIFVHEQGLYAVYAVPEGQALTPEYLATLSKADLETAIRSIARFFHALHTHRFPESLMARLPAASDGYDVAPTRMRKSIQFVRDNSSKYNTAAWEVQLDRLEPSLKQRWALTQCDPQPGFFVAIDGDLTQLCMGSFYDARRHDPAIDIHDFILEIQSDMEDEVTVRQIADWIVEHYPSDDPDLPAKIEFGLLGYDVRWARIRVRQQLREEAAQAG